MDEKRENKKMYLFPLQEKIRDVPSAVDISLEPHFGTRHSDEKSNNSTCHIAIGDQEIDVQNENNNKASTCNFLLS